MIEQTLGSVLWMAPEVLTGKATSVKPSADIWSLGCAIIELLQGGETPWCEAFASPHSALWAIGISKCAPSNLPRDVSPACSDFFEMCFQQQESARATARALLAHPFVAGTSTASTCDDASSSNSRSNAVGGSEVGTGRSSHGELFGGDCDEYEHPAPVTPTVTLTRVVGDGGGGGDARQGSSARTPSSSQGGGGGSQGRNRFTVTSTTTTPRSPLLSIGAGRRVASVPRFADPVPSPAQDVAADTHAAGQGSH